MGESGSSSPSVSLYHELLGRLYAAAAAAQHWVGKLYLILLSHELTQPTYKAEKGWT